MKQRLITAAVGIPVVLAILLCVYPGPLLVLVALLMAFGADELRRLVQPQEPMVAWGQLLLLAAVPAIALTADEPSIPVALTALWAVFALGMIGLVGAGWPRARGWPPVLATFWLSAPLAAILLLHRFGAEGRAAEHGWFGWNAVLLAVLPLWAGDSAAIFAGRAFGKHRMAPSISPNKTWEGAAANLGACLAIGVAVSLLMGRGWGLGACAGLACGVFGQLGDLLESCLKRRAGIKDSGDVLPGHGGVLDRIDSTLMTALPVATIALLWPGG